MFSKLKINKTLLGILLLGLTALILPIILLVSRDITSLRSSAALPNNLEAEQGVLSSGATKQNDSDASGGQYVFLIEVLIQFLLRPLQSVDAIPARRLM